ncbi:MAG: MoaD/ThiS family protein [Actinomycetota bacterium]|nr:MoaD/ThiS family protein [Actinomycetota bacterium]
MSTTTEVRGVTVNYFAAARAAAGAATETIEASSLAEVIAAASQRHGPGLAKVLGVCSFLVDGVRRSDHDAALPHGSSVDVLPPFAGG